MHEEPRQCKNGHHWVVETFEVFGEVEVFDEGGEICPHCGEPDQNDPHAVPHVFPNGVCVWCQGRKEVPMLVKEDDTYLLIWLECYSCDGVGKFQEIPDDAVIELPNIGLQYWH